MPKQTTAPDQFRPNWIEQLDQRYGFAHEIRARYQRYADDLGGEASLSYAQLSLISHALFMQVWLNQQEHALAKGQEIDMGRYTQAMNSLQGIFTKLGLERRAKEVPSLSEYINRKGAKA
ncbi:hypothetical protein [Salicola sp. Rm-C-2C1-2]|uniref:hypothetical protein n=1 Tax=Salicola sp. Rm-C-2C1-2 TaxID=3141321 RepID=UPI0032E39022